MNPLQRLTALLGNDVFFVPCEWGTKKPRSEVCLRCVRAAGYEN
jgi:hypothetical protein